MSKNLIKMRPWKEMQFGSGRENVEMVEDEREDEV